MKTPCSGKKTEQAGYDNRIYLFFLTFIIICKLGFPNMYTFVIGMQFPQDWVEQGGKTAKLIYINVNHVTEKTRR